MTVPASKSSPIQNARNGRVRPIESPPTGVIVGRLADELTAATVMAEDCQEALGEALAEGLGDGLRRDLAERLQRLDELTQRLSDLAGLVERLAEGCEFGEAPTDLFDDLKLSDLRSRLSGARSAPVVTGDLDLW
jgi:hypothetical protein